MPVCEFDRKSNLPYNADIRRWPLRAIRVSKRGLDFVLRQAAKTWQWMQRMAIHWNGIPVMFARTDTVGFWQRWISLFAHTVLFILARLHFYLIDGTKAKGNAGGPSALISYINRDAATLLKPGIAGQLVLSYREKLKAVTA
jgi:hypothetical protein